MWASQASSRGNAGQDPAASDIGERFQPLVAVRVDLSSPSARDASPLRATWNVGPHFRRMVRVERPIRLPRNAAGRDLYVTSLQSVAAAAQGLRKRNHTSGTAWDIEGEKAKAFRLSSSPKTCRGRVRTFKHTGSKFVPRMEDVEGHFGEAGVLISHGWSQCVLRYR